MQTRLFLSMVFIGVGAAVFLISPREVQRDELSTRLDARLVRGGYFCYQEAEPDAMCPPRRGESLRRAGV